MSVIPNLICRSDAFPVNITARYLMDINSLNIYLYGEAKGPDSQHNIEEQNWRTDAIQTQDLICKCNNQVIKTV